MKLRKLVCFLAITIGFQSQAANVECRGKVQHIQVEPWAVLYKLNGQEWHLLGLYNDATKSMFSALLSAQATGKEVMVRHPAGFDCKEYELKTSALAVRTY